MKPASLFSGLGAFIGALGGHEGRPYNRAMTSKHIRLLWYGHFH